MRDLPHREQLNWRVCAALLIGTFLALLSATAHAHSNQVTAKEALAIGTQAYIYGYPLVTMEITRRVMTNVAEP